MKSTTIKINKITKFGGEMLLKYGKYSSVKFASVVYFCIAR